MIVAMTEKNEFPLERTVEQALSNGGVVFRRDAYLNGIQVDFLVMPTLGALCCAAPRNCFMIRRSAM